MRQQGGFEGGIVKNLLGFLRRHTENNRAMYHLGFAGLSLFWSFVRAAFKGLNQNNCLHFQRAASPERLDGFDVATACGNTRQSQVHLICSAVRILISAVTQAPLLFMCGA